MKWLFEILLKLDKSLQSGKISNITTSSINPWLYNEFYGGWYSGHFWHIL